MSSELTTSGTTLVTTPAPTEIVTERIFDAPRQLVFETYIDPLYIPEFWGPRNTTTVVDKMDVRPGGQWRFVHDPGTDQETAFRGEYLDVNPPESISQTFEWEGLPGHILTETAYFEDLGDGRTKLRTLSIFDSVEDRDGMIASGMESGLRELHDRFAEVLARLNA
ncbi:MAG TPA: SRPBCC family protein [Acidimicrobiia bacterium]|nr:SRPBCC family protein [Acidimicrobiia bacterium]